MRAKGCVRGARDCEVEGLFTSLHRSLFQRVRRAWARSRQWNCSRVSARKKGLTAGSRCRGSMPDRPNDFLVCVTETNSRAQIDALVEGLSIQYRSYSDLFMIYERSQKSPVTSVQTSSSSSSARKPDESGIDCLLSTSMKSS